MGTGIEKEKGNERLKKGLSILLILFFSVLFTWVFYSRVENFFVFYPERDFPLLPSERGLVFEDQFFTTRDGTRLHGWFFPGKGEGPVVLFSHGNGGNISDRIDNVRRLLDCGLRVFIYDYRGYGKSDGKPFEAGIYEDGLAAWDLLVKGRGISSENIVLFGRSLGAAVAVDIATKRTAKALIMESGFTSTREMAKTMPLFQFFAPIVPVHYNNLEKIKRVKFPTLIIHGTRDELIPFRMGEALYEAASGPKYFFPVHGAGHNDTYEVGGEEYFKKLCGFAKDEVSGLTSRRMDVRNSDAGKILAYNGQIEK